MVDLKSILPKQDKKDKGDNYWSLSVEPGWIQAGIWTIAEEKATVIASSAPTSWEKDEELVDAADAALSSAVQTAPEDIDDPNKTVFGVPSYWVSGGEIKDEHLEKIKKLCSDLSLKPVGFVVLPEAIAHFIKTQESSPLSAIVLGVSKEQIEISYFKLGGLVTSSKIARSVSIVDDVFEGLSRIADGQSLPSRFILYDGRQGELDEVKQALVKADWNDLGNIEFLHAPKIEIITPEEKISAVCLAGASELADVTALAKLDEEQKEDKTVENVVPSRGDLDAKDLGFVLGEDVAEKKETAQKERSDETQNKVVSLKESGEEKQKKAESKISLPSFSIVPIFQKMKNLYEKLPLRMPGNFVKKPLIMGVIFLLLLAGAGFAFWWYYPKATVTIYVSPKRLDERVSVTVDPGADGVDVENEVLAGRELSTNMSGEKTKQTTGTKTVGEKAQGEVTIYRVGPSLTLSEGTVLNGPSDLDFVLDQDVTVASGSAGTPGTTNTSVTAGDIGAQFNLAANTTFTVSNYSTSDMEARNENAFSGGTSREIRAVSELDQEELKEELQTELEEKAIEQLSKEVGSNDFFIEESLTVEDEEASFSNKVGDEADNLKLTLNLGVQAIAVSEEALTNVARGALEKKVPEGFILRGDQIEFDFEYEGEEDDGYQMDARITANLLPEINPDEIAEEIAGRYPVLAKSYLTREVPGFARAEIKLRPSLPGRLGTLPHITKNIEIEISSDR